MSETPESMPSLGEALERTTPAVDEGSANVGVLSGALFGALATLVIGVLVFYGWKQWSDPTEGVSSVGRGVGSAVTSMSGASSLVQADYAGWGVYRDVERGYFVQIPPGWIADVTSDADATLLYDQEEGPADVVSISVPEGGVGSVDDSFEFVEIAEVGNQTFSVFEEVEVVPSSLLEGGDGGVAEESFEGEQSQRLILYVLGFEDEVLFFQAPSSQRSVLLSVLRSFERLSGGDAVAGLGNSDVLFARSTWQGLHELVGYSIEDGVETTHLTLTAEQGAVRDADVSTDRSQLAYVTDRAIYLRDLATGKERVIGEIGDDNQYRYETIEFSVGGSFVAGRTVHPFDPARPYVMRLETDALVPDDITFPPDVMEWVSDERLMLLFQGGVQGTDGVQLYNVETDETVYLDVDLWLGSARPFAASMRADGEQVAVLGTDVFLSGEGDDQVRQTRLYLWLFDAATGERLKTVDTQYVLADGELPTYDWFGIAWSDDGSQLALSYDNDTFVLDPEQLSGLELAATSSDIGTVRDMLPSGELVLEQTFYSSGLFTHFRQARLYDPVAQQLLYVSEPSSVLSVPR